MTPSHPIDRTADEHRRQLATITARSPQVAFMGTEASRVIPTPTGQHVPPEDIVDTYPAPVSPEAASMNSSGANDKLRFVDRVWVQPTGRTNPDGTPFGAEGGKSDRMYGVLIPFTSRPCLITQGFPLPPSAGEWAGARPMDIYADEDTVIVYQQTGGDALPAVKIVGENGAYPAPAAGAAMALARAQVGTPASREANPFGEREADAQVTRGREAAERVASISHARGALDPNWQPNPTDALIADELAQYDVRVAQAEAARQQMRAKMIARARSGRTAG